MGLGESAFSIIFIVTGAVAIIAGLNFDNKYRGEYKGVNKAEYIKVNKLVLISMGGIMLFGVFLGQGLPVFKDIITVMTFMCLLALWIVYSIISKKRFSNKK